MLILDVLGHQAYIQLMRQCVNVERHLPLRRTPHPLFHCHVWVSSLQHSSIIEKALVRLQCSFYYFNWMRSLSQSFVHSFRAQVYALDTMKTVWNKETHFNLFHYPSFLGYRVIGFSKLKLPCIKIDLQRWLFHLKNEIPLWSLIPLWFRLQCRRCHDRAFFLWKISLKLFVRRVHLVQNIQKDEINTVLSKEMVYLMGC